MKRRGFIRALATTPAASALLAQQPAPTKAGLPLKQTTDVAEATHRFFTPPQFATLQKLGAILVPPVKNSIGAAATDAPEFLDYLISVSPSERQTLYRTGLEALNTQSRRQFAKAFSELDARQADTILKPLLTAVPWVYDLPKDPLQRFVYQVHQDLRTATRNSPAAAAAGTGGGSGLYWNPIDPV